MGLSIGILNAVLNILLWISHGFVEYLVERIYITRAQYQLYRTGSTTETNSSEIRLSRLFSFRNWPPRCPSVWVVVLIAIAGLLIPMEFFFETGLEERRLCRPREVMSTNGVCASPWAGHSDVGVAATALLVQRFEWRQSTWLIVHEGASKNMIAAEKRSVSDSGLDHEGGNRRRRRLVGSECKVAAESCGENCGGFTIERTGGPFDTVVTNASRAEGQDTGDRFALGDVTFDGITGVGFFFWEGSVKSNTRVMAHGMETVLQKSSIDRVLREEEFVAWNLTLPANHTRLYTVSCYSDGLLSRDLVHAVSVYRTMQLEQPGVVRRDVRFKLSNLEPISSSDVLKAMFALKAEDSTSTCAGVSEEYTMCGDFNITAALPLILAMVIIIGLWGAVLLRSIVMKVPAIRTPHNAETWRSFATQERHRTPSIARGIAAGDRVTDLVTDRSGYWNAAGFEGDRVGDRGGGRIPAGGEAVVLLGHDGTVLLAHV